MLRRDSYAATQNGGSLCENAGAGNGPLFQRRWRLKTAARANPLIETRKVEVEFTDMEVENLTVLLDTGLYGRTLSDVVERIVATTFIEKFQFLEPLKQ